MARSLGDPRPPPEALVSDQDRKTLALVRRDIWTSGAYGFLQGSLGALVLHSMGQVYESKFHAPKAGVYYVKKFNRNTALASFFLGGALASFLMSTVAGKNEVHNLHPIYTRHQDGDGGGGIVDDHETELTRRERNRLLRRETLEKQMELGHGGLSDSHGGHWIHDDDNDFKQNDAEK